MTGAAREIALGPFRVDLTYTRVLREGIELDLRPQVCRVFKVLIQNQGRLVGYERIIRDAWDVHVSLHTVATTVNELKKGLEEYGDWIVCRPRLGYSLEMPKSEEVIRRGWQFWNQYTRAGFENALKCFQQAAENDAGDFRAFAAISSTYLMLACFLLRDPCEIRGAFLESHSRAVALGGLTPELRLDRAFGLYVFEQKIAEAEAELLAVRRELSDSVDVNIRLALLLFAAARMRGRAIANS
jgi:DNA-binding winged helix-turn-helix (wHTH) protein